jgi:hypothetical protein
MENQFVSAHEKAAFFSLVNHPLKLKLYLLTNLPSAFFSGLNVVQASEQSCTVTVPYKNFTKNPFRSTYFASLSMAAELSTGVLAMANVYKRKPVVSMLLTSLEGRFYKKVNGKTAFTCKDGFKIHKAVAAAIETRLGQEIEVHSVGKNAADQVVAEFWFTWSFKSK